MRGVDHILFPVDLSEPCRRAAAFVRYLARRTGARMTLLHVIEMSPAYAADWAAYPVLNVRSMMRQRKREAGEFLRSEFRDLAAGSVILRHGAGGARFPTRLDRDRTRGSPREAGAATNASLFDHSGIALPCAECLIVRIRQ